MYLEKDGFVISGERLFNKLALYFVERALDRHNDRVSQVTLEYFQTLRELSEGSPTPARRVALKEVLDGCYREGIFMPQAVDFTVEDWDERSQSGTVEVLFGDRFHKDLFWVRAWLSLDEEKILGGRYPE